MKQRIVPAGFVTEKGKKEIKKQAKIPKIAKNINIDELTKVRIGAQKTIYNQGFEKVAINATSEPEVSVNKNKEGVITSIDIRCPEPVEFSIEFDYS